MYVSHYRPFNNSVCWAGKITIMIALVVNKKQLAVSLIIGMVCGVGDKNAEGLTNELAIAICDNVTHALIGAFTYIGTFVTRTNTNFYYILEMVLCAICSSLIDADHFLAAKSLHLKDATNLKSRPIMHCTTFVAVIVFSVLLFSYVCKLTWMYDFGWILAAAFFSHHIRDSKRRGLWLWPLGHTGKIPTFLYIIGQMFLPQFLSMLMVKYSPLDFSKGEFRAAIETV